MKKIFEIESIKYLRDKLKSGDTGEMLEDWRWIFSYSKRYSKQIAIFTVFGIMSTAFSLVSSVMNKYMIDIVTGRKVEMLWMVIAIWLTTNVLSIVISAINMRYNGKVIIAMHKDVQTDVYNRIMDADWQALRKYTSGEMVDRINTDTQTIANDAIAWIPNIIISVFNFVATFVVIWHYSKGMSLIALGAAPFLFFVGRGLLIKSREYQKENRRLCSDLYGYETESFGKMDTIKSMGLVDLFTDQFGDKQEELQDFRLEKNVFEIKRSIIMRGVNMLVAGVAFAYALWLLWTDHITYGTMVLFLQQRGRLTQAFMDVGQVIPNFVNSSVSARRIAEILELPPEKHSEEDKPMEIPDGGVRLVLDDVEFYYEEGENVIEKGGLKVSTGETVALVGPSGRGKTTLLRILLGLIYPQSGRCGIYDEEGNHIEINADSRHLFAYVPQGNTLFSGTIRDNLTMIKPDATDEELKTALEMADAWEFVDKLSEGMDTTVWENGRGLSEGQAQRVAIARALLKDAPIILLDEATSALDVETEKRVLKSLKEHARDRAVIVTTHRPSVLDICDRVYKVEDGSLEEGEY